MKKMARTSTKKSYSWWWDSHVSPKNSKWLDENLQEMDRCVKEMLKMIEEEGDSLAKKAEMYYRKRPELIAHVEDIYRMYRALAERYDNLTGDLRKSIPSELQSQGSCSGSDLGSEPPSPSLLQPPELTPERKPPRPKPRPRAAGFEFFLGSGGSSDLSRKGSDGSSSSSPSDSESDDSKDANGDDVPALHHRIFELENELHDVTDKLHELEGKGSNHHFNHFENGGVVDYTSRIAALEKELAGTDEKFRVAEAEIMALKQQLEEKSASSGTENVGLEEHLKGSDGSFEHFENEDHEDCNSRISALERELMAMEEKLRVSEADSLSLKRQLQEKNVSLETGDFRVKELEELVGVLEAEISHYKQEINDLKGAMMAASQQFETDILHRDRAIEQLKTELTSLSETHTQEKARLEAEVTNLEGAVEKLQAETIMISQEKLLLEAKVNELEHMINELEVNAARSADRFSLERCAHDAQLSGLLQSNAALEAKVTSLQDEVKRLDAEKMAFCAENANNLEELNNNIDIFRLKTDTLTASNDELSAKVSTLIVDVKSRDDRIFQMNEHLHQLHLEHAKLITEIEVVRRAGSELRSRVKELEAEVDQQRAVIFDSAEGKREAIRQLCFSLEHYRDGYYRLRQVLQGHKRPASAILAS